MISFLSSLSLLNPWVLTGFLALPALWLLLRITPPAPKIIILPTIRFLKDLIPEQQTPSRTPWWLLALRLLIATLLLLAMAHPVINPAASLPGDTIRIVMDNGWAASQSWDQQQREALEILSAAEREDRNVILMTTAPMAGQDNPYRSELMSAASAKSALRSIQPMPWNTNYNAAAKLVEENKAVKNIASFWLSPGLYGDGFQYLANTLKGQGSLSYYAPPSEKLPAAIKRGEEGLMLAAPHEMPQGLKITVQALDENGRVLDQQDLQKGIAEKINTTATLQGKLASYRIIGESGAGGTYIVDDMGRKRSVGIVGPSDDTAAKPFIEERYYLTRALEPYATVHLGSIETLIEENPALIILPDTGEINIESLTALQDWIKDGGTLLRFSGPLMAESIDNNSLVPVPLRLSSRSMSGALTWEQPAKLKDFPITGPLSDINVPNDITVRTQILAEPSDGLAEKTWARLEDGTPLITGSPIERGLLVLVHTTASPLWSDLALSGAYVEILRRIIALSGHGESVKNLTDGTLQPLWVFDGLARKQKPGPQVKPIAAADFNAREVNSSNPPGMYGIGPIQKALNIGDHLGELKTPSNIKPLIYGQSFEQNLMPSLLSAALILLLIDWVVMIALYGSLKLPKRLGLLPLLFLTFINPSYADEAQDIRYADGLYLAYVRSGDSAIDSVAQAGLENLAKTLTLRTSVEPEGVIGLDLEKDNLVFFPLIYWPVKPAEQALSPQILAKLQNYLNHGGTILFDTRTPGHELDAALRTMIGPLNIPPLHPIPEDHVLKRSFYLLDNLPGRYDGGEFWVEEKSASGRDDVSSILIGSNDWASAWAAADPQNAPRQAELSLRFGVNLMMYALTGNYKSDQIHVPHILERLGR